MKKLYPLFLVLALLSPSAQAEFYSGSTLYSALEKDIQNVADYQSGTATGYVIGVFDALSGVFVCSPSNVTVMQVEQVVYNYMQKHPEVWDKPADFSVIAAVVEVWPCKKK